MRSTVVTAAAILAMVAMVATWPRVEPTAKRVLPLLRVGMTYDEAKAVLGGEALQAGTVGTETDCVWSFCDHSSIDVSFDANQRLTNASLPPKREAGPWWDILTHMGY
jgi:hypothetical protein